MVRRNFTRDVELEMKDAGLIAASAAAQVASAAKILDLGDGLVEGDLIIDVSALEIDTDNEAYTIVIQLSPDSDFGTAANIVDQWGLHLGAKETKLTDSDADDATGRYIVPFSNERKGTIYRYARLYTVVAGAGVTTGINYTAYLCKR